MVNEPPNDYAKIKSALECAEIFAIKNAEQRSAGKLLTILAEARALLVTMGDTGSGSHKDKVAFDSPSPAPSSESSVMRGTDGSGAEIVAEDAGLCQHLPLSSSEIRLDERNVRQEEVSAKIFEAIQGYSTKKHADYYAQIAVDVLAPYLRTPAPVSGEVESQKRMAIDALQRALGWIPDMNPDRYAVLTTLAALREIAL